MGTQRLISAVTWSAIRSVDNTITELHTCLGGPQERSACLCECHWQGTRLSRKVYRIAPATSVVRDKERSWKLLGSNHLHFLKSSQLLVSNL